MKPVADVEILSVNLCLTFCFRLENTSFHQTITFCGLVFKNVTFRNDLNAQLSLALCFCMLEYFTRACDQQTGPILQYYHGRQGFLVTGTFHLLLVFD